MQASGVRMFRGIAFGQPPVGDLRWKPPQPVKNWTGAGPATQFGPRCIQRPITEECGLPLQWPQRGLPVPQYLDARQIGK